MVGGQSITPMVKVRDLGVFIDREPTVEAHVTQWRHFNFFLGGQIFFYFSMLPDYRKIGKKQHFICSNLTLLIVPFFLSLFFSSFFLFFSFFLLFLSFFLFFFFLGGDGPPSPPQMTPLQSREQYCTWLYTCINSANFAASSGR